MKVVAGRLVSRQAIISKSFLRNTYKATVSTCTVGSIAVSRLYRYYVILHQFQGDYVSYR